jgi:hypothetical protein
LMFVIDQGGEIALGIEHDRSHHCEKRDRGSDLGCCHRGVELLFGCSWAVRQYLFGRRIEDCHGLGALYQLSVDQSRSGLRYIARYITDR